jgi:subtilase family serine protease
LPTAETLGVQGFPQMMNAEQFVINNHLGSVISQSFGAAEESFDSFRSLLDLRDAFTAARAAGITVLASSGDFGTTNIRKEPVKTAATIPFPTVIWPASDPLARSVGGTGLGTPKAANLVPDLVAAVHGH